MATYMAKMENPNKCDWNTSFQFICESLKNSDFFNNENKWRKDQVTLVSGYVHLDVLRDELKDFHRKYKKQQYGKVGKSTSDSEELRNEGNRLYAKGGTDNALECYTKSILKATPGSEVLALGYANRSAVFLKSQKYEDCLLNIEASMKLKPPESCRLKLMLRKAKCLLEMKRKDEAEVAIKELEQMKRGKSTEVKNLRQQLKNLTHPEEPEVKKVRQSELLEGPNPRIPAASAVLDMRVSEEAGRYVVSEKPIQMGNVLFEERPYASVLLPEWCLSFCSHCHQWVRVPVPCERCSEICYCSEECRDLAWSGYHRHECRWLSYLHSIGIGYLALRIVLVAGFEKLLDFREKQSMYSNAVAGCDNDGVYGTAEDGYLSMYHLCTHHNVFYDEDLKAYTMMSCLLLTFLAQHTDFFGKKLNAEWINDEAVAKDVIFVGSCLLRHIQQLICNAHSITAVRGDIGEDGSVTEVLSQRRVATAVYPAASLMNHSCEPNILNNFDGRTLIVRALKNIKKGEEVFNCYGPHCFRLRRIERRTALKQQYFFMCNCKPCTSNKYLLKEAEWNALLCKCGGPVPTTLNDTLSLKDRLEGVPNFKEECCLSCGSQLQGIPRILKELSLASDLQEQSKEAEPSESVELWKKCLKIRDHYLHPQNIELMNTRDSVAKVLAEQGNWNECASTMEECLKTVETRFGKYSQEIAYELEKYADVLVSQLSTTPGIEAATKLMETMARLMKLMQTHVGADTPAFEEVQKRLMLYKQVIECYYESLSSED